MRTLAHFVLLFALPLSAWAANLDTAFVSQSVPAEMIAGQSVPASVTLKNTGVWGWGPTSGHALGSQNPQDNTHWGLNRVAMPQLTMPGKEVTYNFNAAAPSTPGTYNFQWRMVHPATYGWFGATTPNVAVQVVTPGAEFVSQSVPSSMDPGVTYQVSVTMKNTGSTAWSPGSYKLGSQNPQDNTTWGVTRAELASSVAPGNNGTFTFNVTAPTTPGSYDFQWRMVNSSFGWFGDTSTNVAVNVVTPGASFVSQSVPTSMTPGQTYQVSVTMNNSGPSTWTPGSYRLGSANPLDNTTWDLSRVELSSSVAPGNNATFTFDVVAPTSVGAYNFQWRMVFGAHDWFGATSQNVQVAVGSASGLDFVHVDHLNTPRLVSNQAGQTVWRWDQQEPFGVNVPDENPSALGVFEFPLRFPGQYADKETNLHYNMARDYWPDGGRYVQSDPIGLGGGINTYAYVYNNAVSLTDPEGLAVYICNRKAWGVNARVNHSYIWDGKNNRCCGMNRPYDPIATCKEKGPGPGKDSDSCNLVVGSEGREDEIMKCCKEKASKGVWPLYDCHDLTSECITDAGLENPRAPGGRFGTCDSCSK